MHDAVFVRIRQRARHIAERGHTLGDRQRLTASQACAERRPVLVRHHEVQHTIGVARIVEGHDIGVAQPRGDRDLAEKALAA